MKKDAKKSKQKPKKPNSKKEKSQSLDIAAIVDSYRNNGGKLVDYVMDHFTRTQPVAMAQLRLAVEFRLRSACEDARLLDEDAAACGRPQIFFLTFIESVFSDTGFFPALCALAQNPLDRKTARPLADAIKRGEDGNAASVLIRFRERLRDGFNAEDALRWYGVEIGEELAKGNLRLLERIAEAAREIYKPTVQRWILRAWLPLALWQEIPASTREERLRAAWDVCKACGLSMPVFPEPTARKPYPVQDLIRMARRGIYSARLRVATSLGL